MIILVQGKQAVVKSGSTFEYIAENRLFLGRDGYTLNITFPLRDCAPNRAVFGHIERMDVVKKKISYECEIRHNSITLSGALFVSKVSETEVTCQFADGRCANTAADPFENVYINNLPLGEYPYSSTGDISPQDAWYLNGCPDQPQAVALPWVNEAYPTPPNNDAVFSTITNFYLWKTESLSWQPYLIFIAKKICDAIGYIYDFSEWENSDFKYLIICNTLPATWDIPQFARALPHWTVAEFFEKLELFLMGEFDIDYRAKTVNFAFSKTKIRNTPPVKIENIVESYTTDISTDDDSRCEYIGSKRLAYKVCSHKMWNYFSCDWFTSPLPVMEYASIAEMLESNRRKILTDRDGHPYAVYGDDNPIYGQRPGADGQRPGAGSASTLLYARDDNTYFVFRSIGVDKIGTYIKVGGFEVGVWCQRYVLQPVNVFGSGIPDSDKIDTQEIEFVPTCVMETDDEHGDMMFLSFSSYDEGHDGDGRSLDDRIGASEPPVTQPMPAATIEAGEKAGQSEYYDTIYVGFWNGSLPVDKKMPYPIIDKVVMSQDWTYKIMPFANMRLTDTQRNFASQIPMVNPAVKMKVSFLSDTIPNPRAVFFIHGQRYVCEKITATFTEDGMSQLLKGEFYPIV